MVEKSVGPGQLFVKTHFIVHETEAEGTGRDQQGRQVLAIALPCSVFGPEDRAALRRLATSCFCFFGLTATRDAFLPKQLVAFSRVE